MTYFGTNFLDLVQRAAYLESKEKVICVCNNFLTLENSRVKKLRERSAYQVLPAVAALLFQIILT